MMERGQKAKGRSAQILGYAASAGMDIKALQNVMGHSDASITMNVYCTTIAALREPKRKCRELTM